MEKNLIQKRRNTTYTFTIDESGLLKKINKKHGENEYHYHFESITSNKKIFLKHEIGLLVAAYACIAISIICLIPFLTEEKFSIIPTIIFLFGSPVFFILYYYDKRWILHLYNSDRTAIEFYPEKNGENQLSEFIEQLIANRNKYLDYKYTKLSKFVAYERQLENLNWLLTIKAISGETFEAKRNELNELFKNERGKNTIGF